MASKHRSGVRNEVIRCQNCGEDYSVTYKSCPFCDASAERSRSGDGRGGKRLNNTRGGGYGSGWSPLRIITTILSVALILAAAYIVVIVLKPLVDRGSKAPGTEVSGSPAVSGAPSADPSLEPSESPSEPPSSQPSTDPTASATPAGQTAQSFTLSIGDITLQRAGETYRLNASFLPAGSTAEITWTSSNSTVVHVAADGTVTGLAAGNSTITATMAGGYTQTCIVRCGWTGGATAPTPGTSSSAPVLSRTDITLQREGETFTLKVTGTGSTPTWASSDSSVVSVSGGKVTALKQGTATVTATVDGTTLKCIVRCSF